MKSPLPLPGVAFHGALQQGSFQQLQGTQGPCKVGCGLRCHPWLILSYRWGTEMKYLAGIMLPRT